MTNIFLLLLFLVGRICGYKVAFGRFKTRYFGYARDGELVAVSDYIQSASIILLNSTTSVLGQRLTTGGRTLVYDYNGNRFTFATLDRDSDPVPEFKVVMYRPRQYILQHDDRCLGLDNDNLHFSAVLCSDRRRVLIVSLWEEGNPFSNGNDIHLS